MGDFKSNSHMSVTLLSSWVALQQLKNSSSSTLLLICCAHLLLHAEELNIRVCV